MSPRDNNRKSQNFMILQILWECSAVGKERVEFEFELVECMAYRILYLVLLYFSDRMTMTREKRFSDLSLSFS